MIIKFLIIFTFSLSAFAQFDFKYGAGGRSYPSLGGELTAQAGYNQLIWGDGGKGNIAFGLVRPYIKGGSSVVVSNYEAGITLYPISFLGISAGQRTLQSSYDQFTYYDCEDETRCEGSMTKDYLQGEFGLGFGPIIMKVLYTHFRNSYSNNTDEENTPVGEYEFVLSVAPRNEIQIQKTYVLGFKYNNDLIGLVSDQHEFLESDKVYNLNLLIYRMKFDPYNLTIGGGTLHSSDIKSDGVVIFNFTHTISPSLSIL